MFYPPVKETSIGSNALCAVLDYEFSLTSMQWFWPLDLISIWNLLWFFHLLWRLQVHTDIMKQSCTACGIPTAAFQIYKPPKIQKHLWMSFTHSGNRVNNWQKEEHWSYVSVLSKPIHSNRTKRANSSIFMKRFSSLSHWLPERPVSKAFYIYSFCSIYQLCLLIPLETPKFQIADSE